MSTIFFKEQRKIQTQTKPFSTDLSISKISKTLIHFMVLIPKTWVPVSPSWQCPNNDFMPCQALWHHSACDLITRTVVCCSFCRLQGQMLVVQIWRGHVWAILTIVCAKKMLWLIPRRVDCPPEQRWTSYALIEFFVVVKMCKWIQGGRWFEGLWDQNVHMLSYITMESPWGLDMWGNRCRESFT